MNEQMRIYVPVDFADFGESNLKRVKFLHVGSFDHPRSGKVRVTLNDLKHGIENFNKGIAAKRIDNKFVLHCNYDHPGGYSTNPEENKNSGLIYGFELDGDTVYAMVEWTKTASSYIENKEFLWISPEFAKDWKDENGASHGFTFRGMALTNYPFLKKKMQAVAACEFVEFTEQKEMEITMNEKELREVLKLDDKTDIVKHFTELSAKVEATEKLIKDVKVPDGVEFSDHVAELQKQADQVVSLTEKVNKLEKKKVELPAGMIAVEENKWTEVQANASKGAEAQTALIKMNATMEVDKLIHADEPKITPAQKVWAINYSIKDPEGFKAFVEAAPVQVVTGAKGGDGQSATGQTPSEKINALIVAKQVEFKSKNAGAQLSYSEARDIVRTESPSCTRL